MPSQRVIIEVSPSALEVAVCRGGSILRRCRTELTLGQWPATWTDGLSQLDAALADAVTQLKCGGLPATVIYQGPTPGAVVSITSCAASAGTAAATNAATLALSNLASFPIDANPSVVEPLYRDRSGSVPQLHMIASADSEAVIAAISGWLDRAKLRFDGVMPAEVAAMLAAVEYGDELASTEHVHAALWIAGHTSALAAVHRGRLLLLRPISAGSDLLAEALTRPLRVRDAAATPQSITLDRSEARTLLSRAGIPAAGQPMPGLEACDGTAALPWLQPVLQRLALEIKQSLRFGVAEADRANVRLSLTGPGALVPNLQGTLARLSGVLEADASTTPRSHIDAVVRRAELPCLLSAERCTERAVHTLRRAMLVGVTAAAGLVAFDGLATRQTLSDQRARLVMIRQQTAGGSLDASHHTTLMSYTAARSLQSRVESRLGDAPDWAAALRLIARTTPSSLRIQDLTMHNQSPPAATTPAPDEPPAPPPPPAGGVCTLRGYVFDKSVDGATTIRNYMQKLQGSPLVESVNLTSTQRTRLDGTEGQAFELRIAFVGVPVLPAARSRAVSVAEESRP